MSKQKAGPARIGRMLRQRLHDLSNGIDWCARGDVRRAVLCGELYLCVPPRFCFRLQGPLLFVEEASADTL